MNQQRLMSTKNKPQQIFFRGGGGGGVHGVLTFHPPVYPLLMKNGPYNLRRMLFFFFVAEVLLVV